MVRILCRFFGVVMVALAATSSLHAHPGSGIALDEAGTIFITDTGKGIWKIPRDGKPELISQSAPHWMALDRAGVHANARRNFGKWFWRLSNESEKPAVIACMDYPLAMSSDGKIYWINTETPPGKITERSPDGKERMVSNLSKIEGRDLPVGQDSYATAITVAPDGAIYIVEAAAQVEYVAIRKIAADGTASLVVENFVPAELKAHRHEAVDPIIVPKGEPVPLVARNYCRGLSVAEDGTVYIAATACGAVLALKPGEAARVVLMAEEPWAPTDVALHKGEIYVLEYDHTGHDRLYWTPRVRKVDAAGNVTTPVSIPIRKPTP